MKWKRIEDGDRRTFERFAWWPMACDDGFTRWFERLVIVQKFDGDRGSWTTQSAIPAKGSKIGETVAYGISPISKGS